MNKKVCKMINAMVWAQKTAKEQWIMDLEDIKVKKAFLSASMKMLDKEGLTDKEKKDVWKCFEKILIFNK